MGNTHKHDWILTETIGGYDAKYKSSIYSCDDCEQTVTISELMQLKAMENQVKALTWTAIGVVVLTISIIVDIFTK